MKTTVEFFSHHYGQCVIHVDDGVKYKCGQGDIHELFYKLLGNNIQDEYIDGCTIFELNSKQLTILTNYFADKDEDI